MKFLWDLKKQIHDFVEKYTGIIMVKGSRKGKDIFWFTTRKIYDKENPL